MLAAFGAFAQNVTIPDATFKAYLVGNSLINTNSDAEIQVTEATAFTGLINCENLFISDLTGIEAFTNLTVLNARSNSLTTVNLSQNTALTELRINNNYNLVNLDVSSLSNLQTLFANSLSSPANFTFSSNANLLTLVLNNNGLSSINLNLFPNLVGLKVDGNSLTSLDLTSSPSLVTLNCSANSLTALNTSSNPLLQSVLCQNNSITVLDLSSNPLIQSLSCHDNSITALSVSNLTNLFDVNCSSNQISALDFSSNSSLYEFYCANNPNLTALNLANGNNANMYYMTATSNPNLTCVQVDDVAASVGYSYWTIDPTASYSLNCGGPCTVNIPDANFKAYLVAFSAVNTNGDSEIQCSEATAFTGQLSPSNLSITDLTGIEAFTNIVALSAGQNTFLTSADLSLNVNLESADFSLSGLTSVNVTNCPSLTLLSVVNNNVTSIDVSNNLLLTNLNVGGNDLTTIDLSNNTNLQALSVAHNVLTSIDVSNLPALTQLYVSANQISSLDITNNLLLTFLGLYNTNIASVNVTNLTQLESISAYDTPLTSVDLSNNSALYDVNISNCPNLTSLNIANGNNANMYYATMDNNPVLTCIQVDDPVSAAGNSFWIIDTSASYSINCGVVVPVLVSSITVQGQGGISAITTNAGTLQMESTVLPANADDATYTWSVTNGTGTASIDANGLLTAITNGAVEVIATANDGSGVTGSATITISNQSVGIEENTVAFYLTPNPTNGIVMIQSDYKVEFVQVLNTLGQEVISTKQTSFDLSNLTNGVYFVTVNANGKLSTQKLIKK